MAETNRRGGGTQGVDGPTQPAVDAGPRRPGSDAERRAARALEQRLRELGRDSAIEPLRVRPGVAVAHVAHALIGIVGSVLAVYVPGPGLALAALATLSAGGELTGGFALLRLLTPARASQNVVSDEDNDKPGLIILTAHYDSPRASGLRRGRLGALWGRALFASLALITVCALVRLIGLGGTPLTVVQFIPTVVLIVLTPFLIDAALSGPDPAAADNAVGVQVALDLAASHSARLEHFDLMLLFTGASSEGALGMRNWLKRHRGGLDTEATAVIVVDDIGSGAPRYATKEGLVFASRMHPMLVQLAEDTEGADAYVSRELSDAYLARAAGLPALRVSARGNRDPGAGDWDQTRAWLAAFLQRIDDEIGPRLR